MTTSKVYVPLKSDWIVSIARALGVKRTKEELIPLFSKKNIEDGDVFKNELNGLLSVINNDDLLINTNDYGVLLLTLAEQLREFVPYVGGVRYAPLLLPPLETLCSLVGEPEVRELALESSCQIGKQLKETDLVKFFVPMLKRLAGCSRFVGQASSCGLFHIAYPSAPEELKLQLVKMYCDLCKKGVSVVRKSAASNFGKFVATVTPSHVQTFIMHLYEGLIQDDEDSIRLLAVEALGKFLVPKQCAPHFMSIVDRIYKDKFWGVRFALVNQLCELCERFEPRVDVYVHLLRDKQVEVRVEAAGKVSKFCKNLNPLLIMEHILPCLKDLSCDSIQDVRYALALATFEMALVLGKNAEVLDRIFLSLLGDKCPYVRVSIIINLEQLAKVIRLDRWVAVLLNSILKLSEHKDWRIRLSIIKCMPPLANHLGQDFFNEALCQCCLQMLGDKVSFVHDAAVESLKLLELRFGVQWVIKHLLPQVLKVMNNFECDSREKTLGLISHMLGPKLTCSELVPIIVNAPSMDMRPEKELSVRSVLGSLLEDAGDNLL